MPGAGFEPACLAALAPKASVSASSTTPAYLSEEGIGDSIHQAPDGEHHE